jgi:preprotein translocase subunit SecY
MLETLKNTWKIPETRKRIIFTIVMLLIYRAGSFIPVPYIDKAQLATIVKGNGMFGLMDIVSGGNFSNFTIFAMSITPYINASIIMNLLTMVIPSLQRLQQSGEDGRRKITQYVRYLTMGLALVQALGLVIGYRNLLVPNTLLTKTIVGLTITAGTALLMWMGEEITEKGIGNGISLIIFASIVSRIPAMFVTIYEYLQNGTISVVMLIGAVIFVVAAIVAIVAVTEGQRKVPVQYAKRVVGRKMYGGRNTSIPLRMNQAGVIPIIFASSLTMFPSILASFFPNSRFFVWMAEAFKWGGATSTVTYILFIILFTFFYTSAVFNPHDVANNLKKYGGFIPGIRPGAPTADYIKRAMNRLTMAGGLFLAVIATLPIFLGNAMGVNLQFSGTSLLIVVGVALDTVKQLEQQLLMRNYSGFLK